MIRIAIVDDDEAMAQTLLRYTEKFCTDRNIAYTAEVFRSAAGFSAASSDYDLLLMDIVLPDGNGYDLIRELRERKKNTLVIFVTNMVAYAVKGYEVRAFDFIVKPVDYRIFALKMRSAYESISARTDDEIWIIGKNFKKKVRLGDVLYVDINMHYLTYHTTEGNYSVYGTLDKVKKDTNSQFVQCHRCYLVNLAHVSGIKGDRVYVGEDELLISRNKRIPFITALNEYIATAGR